MIGLIAVVLGIAVAVVDFVLYRAMTVPVALGLTAIVLFTVLEVFNYRLPQVSIVPIYVVMYVLVSGSDTLGAATDAGSGPWIRRRAPPGSFTLAHIRPNRLLRTLWPLGDVLLVTVVVYLQPVPGCGAGSTGDR